MGDPRPHFPEHLGTEFPPQLALGSCVEQGNQNMNGGGIIPKTPLIGPTFQELGELSSKTNLRQELPRDFGRNVPVACPAGEMRVGRCFCIPSLARG